MAIHPVPPTELNSRSAIRILHPGYSTSNILLSLPRVDRAAGTTTFGVHYGTALLACQIIAGNAFDTGRLALDQAGQQLVQLLFDDILTKEVYYFMVGDGPSQYPIVPSFRDWEFPHDRIPDSWPRVSMSSLARRCGISNFSYAVQVAHLVPQEEVLWYQRNDMERYGDAIIRDIHNPSNIVMLKADLHLCFDNRWFAITPKTVETTTPHSPQYVTHILRANAAELWPTYHNAIVQSLNDGARPYLFARFAWAILLQVKPFITAGFSRYAIRIDISDEDKIEYKEELLSGPQLKAYYGGGGSQRATPMKKRSKTGSMVYDDDGPMRSSSEDSDVDMDNDWEDMMDWWERRKQISSETAVEEDNQAHLLAELKTHLEKVLPRGADDIS